MKNSSIDNNFEVRAIEIKNKILKEGLGYPNLIAGCTNDEVLHLENKFNISLPESYKVFLREFGHGIGGQIMNDVEILYDKLPNLTHIARNEILIEIGDPKLPEKAFVFSMRYGEQFMFFDASGLVEEPPILYYMEDDAEFTKIGDSIFDILESEIELLYRNKVERESRIKKIN